MNTFNKIILGDAFEEIKKLEDSSIDLVFTDPPYFLDKFDNNWNPEKVKKTTKNQQIKNLPSGMKFDSNQGRKLEAWYKTISKEIFRVLKPGSFFLSFSSPRLLHRLGVAVEDAGFYIRDVFIWIYKESQPKAQSLLRYSKINDERLKFWKTPQVKNNYEPILVAQKPPEKTLHENFLKYNVGLFNFSERFEKGYFPSNVMITEELSFIPPIFLVPKAQKEEYNKHPTVKPLSLIRYLIRLTTQKDAVILDPFLGSGTTAVAAILEERQYIGIEINEEYYKIAQKRINETIKQAPCP